MNEADTCRTYVLPKLQASGWEQEPHSIAEQRVFTDGRIIVTGSKVHRDEKKRADYVLRYTLDFPIAVVEAKARYKTPSAGLQQAKEYAEILGLSFAYATNGRGIVEFDFLTGEERKLRSFPSPTELWQRLANAQDLTPEQCERLLTAAFTVIGKPPRYYQEIAINRVVQAVVQGKRRVLLTMATGTGKTFVAFQICWKLWSARWTRNGEHRRPRVLYLADRNILVDDPHAKMFAPFGDARAKIENGEAVKSREMYFAIYQALAADERRPGLYKEYARGFFDFIIVDECHRGSARNESNWREILEYFEPAYQLGMTATPLRDDNRDTYSYFGNPVYQYSLKQGIADGFLAPYRVHRVVTTYDAAGWRPSVGDIDRYGRAIPDREYKTEDFERLVSLKKRTEAIARHLAEFMRRTDRFAKTIVFCVDQEHADEMRGLLSNLNRDLVRQHPDYVCRVTSDEGDIGRGFLSQFQEPEQSTPVILTTSQLLTTGIDAPTVKNVVLVRIVRSISEFKQIIGRGTRVRDDFGKLFFSILDYTGSATKLFADPDFDDRPLSDEETALTGCEPPPPTDGSQTGSEMGEPPRPPYNRRPGTLSTKDDQDDVPRKFYYDGGSVQISLQLVYELDAEGKQLRVVQLTDYTGERVRTLCPSAAALKAEWLQPDARAELLEKLEARGIDLAELAQALKQPEADPLDLLCHVAYNTPIRTRSERASRLRKEQRAFFDRFSGAAREIIEELLDKYATHGTAQLVLPDVLQVPPISKHGNVTEISRLFGGTEKLRAAVAELQTLLYAA